MKNYRTAKRGETIVGYLMADTLGVDLLNIYCGNVLCFSAAWSSMFLGAEYGVFFWATVKTDKGRIFFTRLVRKAQTDDDV